MSIFPTEILLATDASEETALAARTATDMKAGCLYSPSCREEGASGFA